MSAKAKMKDDKTGPLQKKALAFQMQGFDCHVDIQRQTNYLL